MHEGQEAVQTQVAELARRAHDVGIIALAANRPSCKQELILVPRVQLLHDGLQFGLVPELLS